MSMEEVVGSIPIRSTNKIPGKTDIPRGSFCFAAGFELASKTALEN